MKSQQNIIESIGFPKAVIFDTDNTLYPYLSAHKAATRAVENKVEVLLLRIPIIGAILHKSCIARFSRTLATTISSGIPLLEALKSSAGASGNYIYRTEILSIRREVESGLLLNMAMKKNNPSKIKAPLMP